MYTQLQRIDIAFELARFGGIKRPAAETLRKKYGYKVSESTLRRLLSDPEFAELYERKAAELISAKERAHAISATFEAVTEGT